MAPDFPYLDEHAVFRFPPAAQAALPGVVAAGGNLSPGMLLSAYRQGIFPWYGKGEPILWWSPDPRFVLFPDELHVSQSLQKRLRKASYRVVFDTRFEEVITACGEVPRPGQDGTWITPEIVAGYRELHRLGYAHSAESYLGERLVGGLYGVALGSVFFGESMFSWEPDASKVAFVTLVGLLRTREVTLIDCQVYTPHLERFGAREIPRSEFLALLAAGLHAPTRRDSWS